MELKYKNKLILVFTCTDADGESITNLADAAEIYFQVKETKDSTDKIISVNKTDGNIEVDKPASGQLRITVESDEWLIDRDAIDFELDPNDKKYKFNAYWGVEIKDSDGNYQEINITELTTDKPTVTLLLDTVQN